MSSKSKSSIPSTLFLVTALGTGSLYFLAGLLGAVGTPVKGGNVLSAGDLLVEAVLGFAMLVGVLVGARRGILAPPPVRWNVLWCCLALEWALLLGLTAWGPYRGFWWTGAEGSLLVISYLRALVPPLVLIAAWHGYVEWRRIRFKTRKSGAREPAKG